MNHQWFHHLLQCLIYKSETKSFLYYAFFITCLAFYDLTTEYKQPKIVNEVQ